jgi:1,4-alpha-glucan branching enzyme
MGGEIAQYHEWKFDNSLDWHLLSHHSHLGVQSLVKDLNTLYHTETALFENQYVSDGFEWIDCNDSESSVISYVRKAKDPKDFLLIVCNFTPVPRHDYRIGTPPCDIMEEVFNSDQTRYWGSGQVNSGELKVEAVPQHFRNHSLVINLPPLGVTVFKPLYSTKADEQMALGH